MAIANFTTLKEGSHAYATHNIKTLDIRDIILVIAFVLIFVVGVSGNLLVCYIFNRKNTRLSTMEILIVMLAFADLVSSFLNPIMFTYWTVTFHKAWHFGWFGCKILPSLTRITVSFSIGIILIITIDRCIVICLPFKRLFKRTEVYLAVICALVLSIISELPYTIYQEVNPLTTCQVPDSTIPGFVYPFTVFRVVRDVAFIGIFSSTVTLIYKNLYDKEHLTTLREQKNLHRMKKIMNMLITMAIIFVLLVYPRDILLIVFNISWLSPPGLAYTKAFLDVNSFLKILHMCNSICNVFIYSRLHGKFRRRSKKLFNKVFKGEQYNETLVEDGTLIERRTIMSYSFAQNLFEVYNDGNKYDNHGVKFSITRIYTDRWINNKYNQLVLREKQRKDLLRETTL